MRCGRNFASIWRHWQAYEELGAEPEAAICEALRAFGDAETHGQALRKEWRVSQRRTSLSHATRYARTVLGTMMGLDIAIAYLLMVAPNQEMLLRSALPFSQSLWSAFMLCWIISGSGIIGGWLVGRDTGKFGVRATLRASAAVAACSGALGLFSYLVIFPLLQLLQWSTAPQMWIGSNHGARLYEAFWGVGVLWQATRIPFALLGVAASQRWHARHRRVE